MNSKPDFTKPIDIKAILYDGFSICGCSELDSVIGVIKDLLIWCGNNPSLPVEVGVTTPPERPDYDTLFGGNKGVFYILIGLLDELGFCEHGSGIRYPWITLEGKEFLKALNTMTEEEIDKSEGVAYNGIHYSN